ncbi:MAG: tRNA (5-methylaminomethyl-2-thiouridine)(34)-methyltransferase MnmD [Deinococcales bacterium]|nr:tRNA (5-methylaminomethyl-2-thiouridine)(34)-methyltransferase MnmD [Chitinophagaceae bacterium]
MNRVIQLTNDGSSTIVLPEKGITYHNTSGAIGESLHVFINAGLKHVVTTTKTTQLSIFEMGFGTGLNALLTWQFAQQQQVAINYTSIELYPILPEEASLLNYRQQLQMTDEFTQLHQCAWEIPIVLDKKFTITKTKQSLLNYTAIHQFNIIYYDAFAPKNQPELWTIEVFEKLYQMLLPNGILVTYCSKGDVKRTMKAVRFRVKRLKGLLTNGIC